MTTTPLETEEQLTTPVLLMVFNRPSHTKKVWESLRNARPTRLWIAQDGPRENVTTDPERCNAVRKTVENIDWPCEVRTLYRDENLGCGKAVSSAIEWFLGEAGEGIILEDDIVPGATFFRCCAAGLEHYRNDKTIGSIRGSNSFPEKFQRALSRGHDGRPLLKLHLSKRFGSWGWATWNDRWDGYILEVNDEIAAKYESLIPELADTAAQEYSMRQEIAALNSGMLDTWDFQFDFHCRDRGRYHLAPSSNLIANIGFDEEATHTICESRFSSLPIFEFNEISFPEETVPEPDYEQSAFSMGASDGPLFENLLREIDSLKSTCYERLELVERLHRECEIRDETIKQLRDRLESATKAGSGALASRFRRLFRP